MKIQLIPNDFIITQGSGQSEHTDHAGSYHIALHEAGICDYNIQTYSSVLPKTAKIKCINWVGNKKPVFGSELQTIMSCITGAKGEQVSAGIIYAWMYSDIERTKKVGGLVCELTGKISPNELRYKMMQAHKDLHKRTYSQYYLGEPTILTETLNITENYGTSLVALCFLNHKIRFVW